MYHAIHPGSSGLVSPSSSCRCLPSAALSDPPPPRSRRGLLSALSPPRDAFRSYGHRAMPSRRHALLKAVRDRPCQQVSSIIARHRHSG
eukprot:761369-Hanusia_phi.AAC.11